jgi:nucleotide-binding universal stress UspA family protein
VRSAGLPTDAVDHVESYDVLDGIVRLSRDADLIVMGSATDDPLGYVFGRSLAQEITENVRCPVLWVKEYEERPSLWSRLFGPLPKESEVRNG